MIIIVEIGDVLRGKYCILQEIGRGGEGVVYLARDTALGKRWCVKVAGKSWGTRLLCRMEHEHLPQVVDYWEEGAMEALVMEYIEGETLGDILKRGGVSRHQAVMWSRQLLQVAAYLHEQSPAVVYGDFKPENVMISREHQLYLVDFGSARGMEGEGLRSQKGTKKYAAPEQSQGKCLVQSDIYGLGKVLEALWKAVGRESLRKVSPVLKKATREEAEERYQSCKEFQRALEKRFAAEHLDAPRVSLPLLVLGLLVVFCAGVSLNRQHQEEHGRMTAGEIVQKDEKNKDETGEEEENQNGNAVDRAHKALRDYFQEPEDSVKKPVYYRQAKKLCQQLAETGEERQKSHFLLLLARLCQENGELQRAELCYRSWMEKNPGKGEGCALYGLMLLEMGEGQKAKTLFQEYEVRPEEAKIHNYRIWRRQLEKEGLLEEKRDEEE